MLTAVSSRDTAASNSTSSTQQAMQESQDRFLTLLVTQMQNQDPLNPMDNAQLTTQLAQISTVQGIEKLNSTMEQVMASFASNQTLEAAGMIGRSVLVPGNKLQLVEGQAKFGMELAGPAEKVKVSVRDANGREVRTWSLEDVKDGRHVLAWDGKDAQGNALPNGAYSVSVSAVRGSQDIPVTTLAGGRVTSVARSDTGMTVSLASGEVFGLADVREIF
jgi:flagellar basal-body rod modification protein FlgD